MRASFFRHVIGGMAVATTLAAFAFAGLVWLISPSSTTVPWEFAAVALIEGALLGGVFGACVFLRSLPRGDADEGNGGQRDLAQDYPVVLDRERERKPQTGHSAPGLPPAIA